MISTIDPYRTDGRSLQFDYHPGQLEAMKRTERFILISAGTQGGKTIFEPWWLLREIRRCGPGDYLFATPSFTLMEKKALPEFLRLFKVRLQLGDYVGGSQRIFTLTPRADEILFGSVQPERSRVVFGHAQDPDSLESATYKAAVLDEAGQKKFKRGSWEAIQRRLSIHKGRALIGTTPYGLGWLKSEVYDRAQAGEPDYALVRFDSTENPAFPAEEFERMRAILPRWKFNMMYRGMFERPAGMILDAWDAGENTCPRFAIPANWTRYRGLDFGGVNTAAVYLAKEPYWDRYYLYRTYLAGSRTAAEHKAAMDVGEPGLPIKVWGGAGSEDNWRREFRAAGLPVQEPPVREVEVGIDRLYDLIKTRRLIVFDDERDFIDEVESYSRVLDEEGEPTEKIEDKETYHLTDAARYLAAGLLHRTGATTQTNYLKEE